MKAAQLRPGDVHSNIILTGDDEHTKQLVQNGGEELHHHMSLHGMQTLQRTREIDLWSQDEMGGLQASNVLRKDKQQVPSGIWSALLLTGLWIQYSGSDERSYADVDPDEKEKLKNKH